MPKTIDIRVIVEEDSKVTTYEDSKITNYVKFLFEFDNYGHDINVKNIKIVPISPEFSIDIPFNFVKSIISGRSCYPITFKRSEINLNKIYFEFELDNNNKIKSNEVAID